MTVPTKKQCFSIMEQLEHGVKFSLPRMTVQSVRLTTMEGNLAKKAIIADRYPSKCLVHVLVTSLFQRKEQPLHIHFYKKATFTAPQPLISVSKVSPNIVHSTFKNLSIVNVRKRLRSKSVSDKHWGELTHFLTDLQRMHLNMEERQTHFPQATKMLPAAEPSHSK